MWGREEAQGRGSSFSPDLVEKGSSLPPTHSSFSLPPAHRLGASHKWIPELPWVTSVPAPQVDWQGHQSHSSGCWAQGPPAKDRGTQLESQPAWPSPHIIPMLSPNQLLQTVSC